MDNKIDKQTTSNTKNEMKGCPACGLMSFPPIFAPKPDDKKPDVKDKDQQLGGCPACGQMSFGSFSSTK